MRTLIAVLLCLVLASAVQASPLAPTIGNAGFEEVAQGNDAPGWGWYSRAKASFHSETANPHSGKRCLVFSNESNLEPEVYARLFQNVGVLPGTEYELSLWVRGEEVASSIHLTDWSSYTLNLPSGSFGWRKVSLRFRTRNDQSSLNLGINLVNSCKVLAIDDISLRAMGTPFKGQGIDGSVITPGSVEGDNAPAFLRMVVNSSRKEPAVLKVQIRAGKESIFSAEAPIQPGQNAEDWQWSSGRAAARKLTLTIKVVDAKGKALATYIKSIEKMSPSVITADVDRIQARLKEFDTLAAKCRAKGIALDYPMVARTTLAQFLPLVREDLAGNEIQRAGFAVKDLSSTLRNALVQMRAYLKDPKLAPNARRYQTGKIRIEQSNFVGERKDSRGHVSQGPVFFSGYGHFGQVVKDIPRFPGYGVNLIQIELGPSSTLISESEVSLKAAQDVAKVLDNAAKQNIMVNVLLSPHYFPGWAMQKWPHLGKAGGGLLGYCVDAPEAKQVVEKFLRTVVPILRGKPALHSFCLSNEPVFDRGAGAENTKPMWAEYLQKVHGDIATLNARYGTQYSSFDDVPIPGNDAYTAPQFYDYCEFNMERFAGWHQWMADIIHEMAPEVPVHAKSMNMMIPLRHTVSWGVDPERFGELCQINGNDCTMWPGGGGWGTSWNVQNMTYDIQRSLNRKPIFNSENHLVPDRSTYYVAPEHFRTALWQGAVHGQGATTIWVWERAFDKGSDFYGSVMHRPGCAEAVGRTNLDLNRFAEEVTALQRVPAPVAIPFSMAAICRDPGYLDSMGRAYSGLNFCGVKVDFISDRQLTEGKGKQYKYIVVPEAIHVPQTTFEALSRLPQTTQLILIGDPLRKDPYNHELPIEELSPARERAIALSAASSPEEIWERLGRLMGASSEVAVVDAATGKPVWGVEWLATRVNGRMVVNLVNLLDKPVTVKLMRIGKPIEARDLLSLGGREKVSMLKPITPVLAEVITK